MGKTMKESQNRECTEIAAKLADYSVGGCSARLRRKIEDHVASCSKCARELDALARTASLIQEAGLEKAPDAWNAIVCRLRPKPLRTRTANPIWWLARHKLHSAAAAGAVLITIGALLFTNIQNPPEIGANTYFAHHATMSWNEPFADKAVLGLVSCIELKKEGSL